MVSVVVVVRFLTAPAGRATTLPRTQEATDLAALAKVQPAPTRAEQAGWAWTK
jgi:hypothetical protein